MKEWIGARLEGVRGMPYERLFVNRIAGSVTECAAFFHGDMLAAWEQDGVTEIIFEMPREDAVRAFLTEHYPDAVYDGETEMHYRDWESGFDVTPVRVAGFFVCPSWDLRESEPGETRIVLDAGLAFGTGMHPTTQSGLALLRIAIDQLKPARVLDLGGGSGALSVAAALLGAHVTAVDFSLVATHAVSKNAAINHVEDKIQVIQGDARNFIHDAPDLTLCNINPAVIYDLLATPVFQSHTHVIFSGIHSEDSHEEFTSRCRASGRRVLEHHRIGPWNTYLTEAE